MLLAFATAALLGAAMGPCKGKGSSETDLFRGLVEPVQAGDVVRALPGAATHRVGQRPGRVEPREEKRRQTVRFPPNPTYQRRER